MFTVCVCVCVPVCRVHTISTIQTKLACGDQRVLCSWLWHGAEVAAQAEKSVRTVDMKDREVTERNERSQDLMRVSETQSTRTCKAKL